MLALKDIPGVAPVLGHSLLYRLSHPVLGAITVLNSSLGQSAVLFL